MTSRRHKNVTTSRADCGVTVARVDTDDGRRLWRVVVSVNGWTVDAVGPWRSGGVARSWGDDQLAVMAAWRPTD